MKLIKRELYLYNFSKNFTKKIKTIRIFNAERPILNSEYLNWTVKIAAMPQKERTAIIKFLRTVLSLADKDSILEFLRIEINGLPITFETLMEYDYKEATEELLRETGAVIDMETVILDKTIIDSTVTLFNDSGLVPKHYIKDDDSHFLPILHY